MRKLITVPDPRLRQKSAKVKEITPEIREIIADMVASSLAWEAEHPYELSAAMAAPQLGENKRIIIVRDDLGNKDINTFTALINPIVLKTEGKTIRDHEGCLSVPEVYGLVPRPRKVRIKALLEDGREVRLKAEEYLARTLLHEIDHLDGLLFVDRIKNNRNAFYQLDQKGNLQEYDYDEMLKNIPHLFQEEEQD